MISKLYFPTLIGNGVSPSRESVEAAIADIKQAIRRTKNLPLKTHPQEKQDRGPVWIPRYICVFILKLFCNCAIKK